MLSSVYANATFDVFTDTCFKEVVCFPFEGDRCHPRGNGLASSHESRISRELDVLAHEGHVHVEEVNGGS
jgi:hypothetical protein